MMKNLFLLALLLPLPSLAATFYTKAEPTILKGAYQDLKTTEIKFAIDGDAVKICGINHFSDGRKGPISRKWNLLGDGLYMGREKVGTLIDNRVYVELKYSVAGQPQKQIIVLQIDEAAKTMLYALKDTYVGGYEVIGALDENPSQDLLKACPN